VNTAQAKEILMLYRPDTADADDPAFAEALALCERDPELKRWFEDHCAVYKALRARFKQIPIPEALKEQILAERKVHTTQWRRPAIVAVLALIVVVATFIYMNTNPALRPEPTGFLAYREEMVSYALRQYSMQLLTKDLNEIRGFFAGTNGVADYVLPRSLEQQAQAAGCVAFTWQGKPVSMICFHSGRPLAPGQQTDVWLFVIDESAVPDGPSNPTPKIERVNRVTTASWSTGRRTYVIAADGDEQFLKRFL
jgi:hypothetical protein